MDFNFLEGKPFNQQDLKNANQVAVITDHARDQYFGPGVSAVGKYIVVDGMRYRVSGVVEDVPISRFNSYANIWVPLSTAHINKDDISLNGEYMAIILASIQADIPKIKAEYQHMVKQVKVPNPKQFDKF